MALPGLVYAGPHAGREQLHIDGLLMPATYIGGCYIDPAVAQFVADLSSSITIKVAVYRVAATAIDRCAVLGDLLIALTRVCRP